MNNPDFYALLTEDGLVFQYDPDARAWTHGDLSFDADDDGNPVIEVAAWQPLPSSIDVEIIAGGEIRTVAFPVRPNIIHLGQRCYRGIAAPSDAFPEEVIAYAVNEGADWSGAIEDENLTWKIVSPRNFVLALLPAMER